MVNKDDVVALAVAGQNVRAMARHLSCSQAVVRTLLDEFAGEELKPSARAAALALEVARLEQLEAAFTRDALANMDVQAGTLVVKLSSRKAQLLGLDQPLAVVEQDDKTSTVRVLEAIQRLRNEHAAKPDDAQPKDDQGE